MPGDAPFAIVRITRTLVYDAHVSAGKTGPYVDNENRRLLLDSGDRDVTAMPVVRIYNIRIALPRSDRGSWVIRPGDNYELLITTAGFVDVPGGIRIDGRAKSNYQVQLDPDRAPLGPNSSGFGVLQVSVPAVVGVLKDEVRGRAFYEFDESMVESLTGMPPEDAQKGIVEDEDAQRRRWEEWPVVRKTDLP